MSTKQKIEIMQAYVDGKDVECLTSSRFWQTVLRGCEPRWNWIDCEYRIKAEPKYIPWTCETIPSNFLCRLEEAPKGTYMRFNVADDSVWTIDHNRELWKQSYEDLLNNCVQRDGSPCGELVK